MADCLAGALGGDFPGILTLLDLIEGHRSAFEYDWRARFSVGLHAIGSSVMSWGEAYRLALVLIEDPSSRVGAAVADLRGPVSPESLALYGIARNYVAVNTETKPKLFAPDDPLAKRPRPRAQLSVTEVDAIFQRMRGADT